MPARELPLRVRRPQWFGAAVSLAVGALATPAIGRPMDPALSRLVLDPMCVNTGTACVPDRAAYHKLVSQWGFAVAPHSVHSARTTGLAGFRVALASAFTSIDGGADYWRRGTRGDGRGGDGAASGNADPNRLLQLHSLEVRKGLGWGAEIAGQLGIMPSTSLVSWGADVRFAVLEGLRHGAWRYVPDLSIGAGVREVTGLGELSLGVLSLEARASRELPARAGFVVTPWLGFQWVRVGADSAIVDLTPDVDALAECGYTGSNVPTYGAAGEPASGAPPPVFDGAPLCQDRGGDDYVNDVAFGEADVVRQRALVGVSYRQGVLELAGEFITDVPRPDAAQTDERVADLLRCDASGQECRPSPRQWTVVLQLGAVF